FDYNRKKKWKLKALAATSIAGGFLVFLYEKNWLEAIIKFPFPSHKEKDIRTCIHSFALPSKTIFQMLIARFFPVQLVLPQKTNLINEKLSFL
ncbi:hypothetical protein Q7V65_05005, partial [Streptococcus suis]|nr:hypothetical protein [Streptococcus suis]